MNIQLPPNDTALNYDVANDIREAIIGSFVNFDCSPIEKHIPKIEEFFACSGDFLTVIKQKVGKLSTEYPKGIRAGETQRVFNAPYDQAFSLYALENDRYITSYLVTIDMGHLIVRECETFYGFYSTLEDDPRYGDQTKV